MITPLQVCRWTSSLQGVLHALPVLLLPAGEQLPAALRRLLLLQVCAPLVLRLLLQQLRLGCASDE
jgi:hypothetical protein